MLKWINKCGSFDFRLMNENNDNNGGSGNNLQNVPNNNTENQSYDWTSSFDDEMKGYVANKGFDKPETLLKSYRNLEKLVGAPERNVKIPDNLDDVVALNEIYNKLGRPETADKYDLNKNEANKSFVEWAEKLFHENGLTVKQARSIVEKWDEYNSNLEKDNLDTQKRKIAEQELNLKKEWGAAYDQNLNIAKKAVVEFGVKPEVIDELEKSMGFFETMRFFNNIGKSLGEDSILKAGDNGNLLTPQAAKSRIEALKNDDNWTSRYLSGDVGAIKEMNDLIKQSMAINV